MKFEVSKFSISEEVQQNLLTRIQILHPDMSIELVSGVLSLAGYSVDAAESLKVEISDQILRSKFDHDNLELRQKLYDRLLS